MGDPRSSPRPLPENFSLLASLPIVLPLLFNKQQHILKHSANREQTCFRKTSPFAGKNPRIFPLKPGIVSPEARHASPDTRYLFPHCPVRVAVSYQVSGEGSVASFGLPPVPGIKRLSK